MPALRSRAARPLAHLRMLAGLSAAAVPCAIVVHLVAEAVALGTDSIDSAFFARHAYFALLATASLVWFAATTGSFSRPAERRRRSALVRAALRDLPPAATFGALLLANIGFFGLTQAIEGMPIDAGATVAGYLAALAGSLLAAAGALHVGRRAVRAILDAIVELAFSITAPRPPTLAPVLVTRRPARQYTLTRPNRPPPG